MLNLKTADGRDCKCLILELKELFAEMCRVMAGGRSSLRFNKKCFKSGAFITRAAVLRLRGMALLFACLSATTSWAAIDTFEFSSDEKRERYSILVDELRCPKCKNNNLSGSNSMIAIDLKREVHTMVEEGKTNDQIAEFMVARYGDFVLYRPRMTAQTALLWGGPIALFVLGVGVVFTLVRGRAKALKAGSGAALSAEELAQLARLTRVEPESSKPQSASPKG